MNEKRTIQVLESQTNQTSRFLESEAQKTLEAVEELEKFSTPDQLLKLGKQALKIRQKYCENSL